MSGSIYFFLKIDGFQGTYETQTKEASAMQVQSSIISKWRLPLRWCFAGMQSTKDMNIGFVDMIYSVLKCCRFLNCSAILAAVQLKLNV